MNHPSQLKLYYILWCRKLTDWIHQLSNVYTTLKYKNIKIENSQQKYI